jgi:short-subunit dehydrogenase
VNNRKIAVITGATSGIGASFAHYFARQGYYLILTGRRRDIIQQVADELQNKYNAEIEIIIADFSSESELSKLIQRIDQIERIEVLVNNAGFGSTKNFLTDDYQNQEKMIQVHIHALLRLTHHVIPKMIKNGKGYIVNVSSIAAFLASPQHELYCSTKAFINVFSESLYMSLKGQNIKVQSLCPGLTRTDFHQKLNWHPDNLKDRGLIKWMTPDFVVQKSVAALNKNKVIVIPGIIYKLVYLSIKILPRSIYYFFAIKTRKKFR